MLCIHDLPRVQQITVLTDPFSRGHDPSTHVHRARLLTVFTEPLLSCVSCVCASRVAATLSPVCGTARCFQLSAVVLSVLKQRSCKRRRIGRCSQKSLPCLLARCSERRGDVFTRKKTKSPNFLSPVCGTSSRSVAGVRCTQSREPERAVVPPVPPLPCLRKKARRSEQRAEVFLLSPLFAPGLRCACVVHPPSFIASVVESVEKHTVKKGVVTSRLCLVSDFSSSARCSLAVSAEALPVSSGPQQVPRRHQQGLARHHRDD